MAKAVSNIAESLLTEAFAAGRPDAVTRCVTPTDALSHRARDGSESDRRLQ
jgi:hypothetical protein